MNAFIEQKWIELIKSDTVTVYNVTTYFYLE